MKRVVSLLVVLGLLALLVPAAALAASPEHITVWAMGAEAQKIDVMVKKFEAKYPNIRITVQAIPWDSAHDKLVTAIAGNTVPDVAQMGTTWMAEFGSIGAFADVSKLLAESKAVKKTDFFPGAFETNMVNGRLVGIPWYVDTRVLYYRTDLLAAKGFKHAPQTWSELKAAAKALAADGGYGLALGANDEQQLLPFVWQNGGSLLDAKGKPAVTSPQFVEALTFYVDMFKEKLAPVDAQGTDLFHEFATGNQPMFFSGPWMVTLLHEQVPQIDGKWSVALMPRKKTRTSFIGGCNLVIFQGSRHKEAAWKFVEFMATAQSQAEWFKASSDLPANRLAWKDPVLAKDPMLKVFGEQLKDARAPENIPQYEQIAAFIKQRLEEACRGKSTPEQAAKELEKDIQSVL